MRHPKDDGFVGQVQCTFCENESRSRELVLGGHHAVAPIVWVVKAANEIVVDEVDDLRPLSDERGHHIPLGGVRVVDSGLDHWQLFAYLFSHRGSLFLCLRGFPRFCMVQGTTFWPRCFFELFSNYFVIPNTSHFWDGNELVPEVQK